jgi:hypothetical protein
MLTRMAVSMPKLILSINATHGPERIPDIICLQEAIKGDLIADGLTGVEYTGAKIFALVIIKVSHCEERTDRWWQKKVQSTMWARYPDNPRDFNAYIICTLYQTGH